MGGGGYSLHTRSMRAVSDGYYDKPISQTFSQRKIHKEMRPKGVILRESRDSAEHPNSVPIIIALDLTGSMGAVPGHLVKDGLPHMVSAIIDAGIADPQILFIGVGDHETDKAPLQVGQFESSDKLIDKWLTSTYLEGGGGANEGESYHLAWFFAERYTEHDSLIKRGKKGFLFTIGDEPTLKNLPASAQKAIMGDQGQYSDETADSLLEKAREKYNIFHIHISETWAGSITGTRDGWQQILGDNLIVAQKHSDVPSIISSIVTRGGNEKSEVPNIVSDNTEDSEILDIPKKNKPGMML